MRNTLTHINDSLILCKDKHILHSSVNFLCDRDTSPLKLKINIIKKIITSQYIMNYSKNKGWFI